MRYDLIPESLEERNILEQAPHIHALFDPLLPLVKARALIAFVELGLAEALASTARSAEGLAADLGLRTEGVEHLLRVLTACGYVESLPSSTEGASSATVTAESKACYSLTRLSQQTLIKGSPAALHDWVRHNMIHWRLLSTLETALSQGEPRDVHHRLDTSEQWATYQAAMLQTARPIADWVASVLPTPTGRHLVYDLGGSHGAYGAAICRRFAPMRCRVLDLPEALPHARALGVAEGIADLVEYAEADLRDTDLGDAVCDVAFMGNIVHHFDEHGYPSFLKRVYRCLRPGGIAAIWDMVPPVRAGVDLAVESFALLFYLSSASDCRSVAAHQLALSEAGFVETTLHQGPSSMHVLVTARRP